LRILEKKPYILHFPASFQDAGKLFRNVFFYRDAEEKEKTKLKFFC